MLTALISSIGGKLISAEERQKNLIVYLAALSVLRQVYKDGSVDIEILERINRKNAEQTDCRKIGII